MTDFDRITCNPAMMSGKPCIRGMRLIEKAGQVRLLAHTAKQQGLESTLRAPHRPRKLPAD